ncbi:MAG: DUF1980 domain-containing protein [Desulforudis sp.]|nr:MAG: DUF1980 domain-containing protein [Desulforudis sp.]
MWIDAFLRFLTLILLAWWTHSLVASGKIAVLIHPRFFGLVQVAAVMLFLVGIGTSLQNKPVC